MQELVFHADSYETLLNEAETLGFTYTDEAGEKHIIVNGPMASGGDYFLNYVGTVYEPITGPVDPENPPTPVARPGVYGRLRANGEASDLPSFSSAITQYAFIAGDMETPGKWVNIATGADAPDYVASIGLIA